MIHEWREDARAFHYYGMSFSEQRTVQKYILTSLGSGKSIYIRETVNLSASETVPGGEVLPVSLWSHGAGGGGGQSCQFGFQVCLSVCKSTPLSILLIHPSHQNLVFHLAFLLPRVEQGLEGNPGIMMMHWGEGRDDRVIII